MNHQLLVHIYYLRSKLVIYYCVIKRFCMYLCTYDISRFIFTAKSRQEAHYSSYGNIEPTPWSSLLSSVQ